MPKICQDASHNRSVSILLDDSLAWHACLHVYLETTIVIIGDTLFPVIKFSLGICYSYVSAQEVREVIKRAELEIVSSFKYTRFNCNNFGKLTQNSSNRSSFSPERLVGPHSLSIPNLRRRLPHPGRPQASSSGTARIIHSTPGPSRSMSVPHRRPPLVAPWTQIEPPPPRLLSTEHRRCPPDLVACRRGRGGLRRNG
jgi:hypothetical protein